jgi:hypothetical protein
MHDATVIACNRPLELIEMVMWGREDQNYGNSGDEYDKDGGKKR